MSKPKPFMCPCCGRKKIEIREIVCPEKKGVVLCQGCGLQVIKDTVVQAVTAWNRRIRSCTLCGHEWEDKAECTACPGCGIPVYQDEPD